MLWLINLSKDLYKEVIMTDIISQYQAMCQKIISMGLAPATPDLIQRFKNNQYAKSYYNRTKRGNPSFLAAASERERSRYTNDLAYRERKKAYMRSYIQARRHEQKKQALKSESDVGGVGGGEERLPEGGSRPGGPLEHLLGTLDVWLSKGVGEPPDVLQCMGGIVTHRNQ